MGARRLEEEEAGPVMEAGPVEEDGGWCSWLRGLLCGAPSRAAIEEDDGERSALRTHPEEGALEQLRSALEEKEEQLRQTKLKVTDLKQQLQQLQQLRTVQEETSAAELRLKSEEQKNLELGRRIQDLQTVREEHLRSAQLREKALTDRSEELSREVQRLRTVQEQTSAAQHGAAEELRIRIQDLQTAHEEHLRSAALTESALTESVLSGRLNLLLQKKQQLSSALELKEEQLRLRTQQVDTSLQEQLRSAQLKEDDLMERIRRYEEQLRRASSSCEAQAQEHRQIMSEMEAFYKDKLTESRSALKEKEEQLRSFKDRVAQNVVLSLKTENTENMNSPVNQSRLTEMYQQLRVCTWPNLHFTSSEQQARALVQEMFTAAAEHMKRATETVCGVKAPSPKVEKFRQTALENLQLALYHSSKQDVFKAAFPHFPGASAELQLASECYWLGCLMALHAPPLRPHWEQESSSVFPRELQSQRLQN